MKDRVRNIILVIALVMTIASTALLLQCVSQGGIGGQGWMIREYLRIYDVRLDEEGATLVIENIADKPVFIQRIEIIYKLFNGDVNKTTIAVNSTFDAGERREYYFWKGNFKRIIESDPVLTLRFINGSEYYIREYSLKRGSIDIVMAIPKYVDLHMVAYTIRFFYDASWPRGDIQGLIYSYVQMSEYKSPSCYEPDVDFCVLNITETEDYVVINARAMGYVGDKYTISLGLRIVDRGPIYIKLFANKTLPLEFKSLYRGFEIGEAIEGRLLEDANRSVVVTIPYAHSEGRVKELESVMSRGYVFSLLEEYLKIMNELSLRLGSDVKNIYLEISSRVFEMYVEEGVVDIETEEGCRVDQVFFVRNVEFAIVKGLIPTTYPSIQVRFKGDCKDTVAKFRVKLPLPTTVSELGVSTNIDKGFLTGVNLYNSSGQLVSIVSYDDIYSWSDRNTTRYTVRTELQTVFGSYILEFKYVLGSDDAMIALSKILVQPEKVGDRSTEYIDGNGWRSEELIRVGSVEEGEGAGLVGDIKSVLVDSSFGYRTLYYEEIIAASSQFPICTCDKLPRNIKSPYIYTPTGTPSLSNFFIAPSSSPLLFLVECMFLRCGFKL